VIFTVVGILFIWSGVSSFQLGRRTARLIATLRQGREVVEAEGDTRAFARSFEAVAQRLAALGRPIAIAWAAFRETLVIPVEENAVPVIRSTVRPDRVFDLSLLRTAGLRPRYQAAMPGMLVGAGLLFTFLGLAAGLSAAGGVVSGTDLEKSRQGLHLLLDTASFKFITSLAGLFLSIAYTGFRNYRIRLVEEALDGFNAALERQMPLATPALLQHEANDVLRQQGASLEVFGNQLAVSIGQSLDAAFDHRLGEHIGPLRAAIEALATRTSSQNEDAVRQMLETFTERLSGGTRDHLATVTENLASLGARLEGLQDGLGNASLRMAQAADDMARRMGDGAEAALSRVTDQMSGLMETLRSVAAQTRDAGADAAERLGARMETASLRMAQAADEMARRMGDGAEAALSRVTDQMSGLIETLQGAAAQTRDAGADAAERLGARIEAAASGLETAVTQMTDRLSAAATGTSEALEQAAFGSRAALAEGAQEASNDLREAARAVRDTLNETGQGLSRQATALASAAEALAARIDALDKATREALAPFAAGAADLRNAAAAARLSSQLPRRSRLCRRFSP
jgi:hypothetical protein